MSDWRVDAAHRAGPHLHAFELGRNRLAVAAAASRPTASNRRRLENLVGFDLSEPFERIREAIEEAHKGARS